MLVPEIALTPQTLARFQRRFARTGMLHSALTDNERLQTWLKCRQGDFDIVLGTRSAIFTPCKIYSSLSWMKSTTARINSKMACAIPPATSLLNAPKRCHSTALRFRYPFPESLYNAKRGRYQHLPAIESSRRGKNAGLSRDRHA